MSDRLIIVPEKRRDAFLELIAAARQRICLSMFRCTDFKIMDALGEALSRGVSVELLLTQRAKGWEKKIRELGQYLESMGARVHRYGEPRIKYHAKYLVIDGSHALVATLNLMKKYFEKTSDYLLMTDNPEVASALEQLFHHDIETPGGSLPAGFCPRLITGPEQTRRRLRDVLESARESILIADHRVTDPEMLALLQRREQEGVSVRVLGRGAIPGLKSHGKAMLIDGTTGVLGSVSLSPPSLDTRRELAILFNDPKTLTELREFLERSNAGVAAAEAGMIAAGMTEADEDEDEDEGEE